MKPFVFRKLLRSTFFKNIVMLGVIMTLVLFALPKTVKMNINFIAETGSNYRQLYNATESADLDAKSAGFHGSFPADVTNGWSNALVPNYMSAKIFQTLLTADGKISNTTIYSVSSTNDPNTVFLATANLSTNGVNNRLPFGLRGAALVTVGGDTIIIAGTNTSQLKEKWTKLIWPNKTVQP